MKSKQRHFVLAAILLFGVFLRFWQLGRIPEGFYSDEALYGYEAYSLLKTGKDQFGNSYPLSIAGFGDYRPALYIYATIPSIILFGLTEYATRLPSALFSSITILAIYLLTKQLTKSSKVSLLAALFISLSPWAIYFGRLAHETNLMTLLILAGLICIFYIPGNKLFTLPTVLLLSTSLYTYHTARIFVPLFLILLAILQRKVIVRNWRILLVALFIGSLTVVPLLSEFRNEGGWARVKGVSFWSDQGITWRINDWRGKVRAISLSESISRVVINKGTVYPLVLLENFSKHFTPSFLLTSGDPNGIYNTPNTGILLWVEPLLILLAILYLRQKNLKLLIIIVGGILIGLLPDSLTKVAPSSARIHIVLPFIALLDGVGFFYLFKKQKLVFSLVGMLMIMSSLWFWHNYLVTRPVVQAEAWQLGVKEMVLKADSLANQYDRIWISRSGYGWIHILFHTKYDPATFQKEVRIAERNDMGFWWVREFGKYYLEWLPADISKYPKTLFIGKPGEFSNETAEQYVISDQYGNLRYWFVDIW